MSTYNDVLQQQLYHYQSFFATDTQGSRLLEPWCDVIGLPIDKVNFLFAQLVSLLLSFVFRYLSPYMSPTLRHISLLLPGLALGFFCFGYQLLNLLFLTLFTYFLMRFCPSWMVQKAVFLVAISYLSALHIVRQIYDYGGYSIDITGPSMIAVQKITLLGFSLHDGMHRPYNKLLDTEKPFAVPHVPSLLEYATFVLQFPQLMSGPTITFADYKNFIEDRDLAMYEPVLKSRPSPARAVTEKLCTSLFFALIVLYVAPSVPVDFMLNKEFMDSSSIIVIILYMIVSTTCARAKYYHAWKLGETLTNAVGFGYSGMDKITGKPCFDLISSVDIIDFEFATSLRNGLNSWNKTTQNWLRFCAYDRNRRFRTLYTYLLSAVWHGYYPGYYLTFMGGALFTLAGRSLRRHLRPHFQASATTRFIYDCLTFAATKFSIAYLVFPFVLLELSTSLQVYRRIYFIGHLVCLFSIFAIPRLLPTSRPKPKQQ